MLTHITIRLDEAARDVLLAGLIIIRDGLRAGNLPSETATVLTQFGTRSLPTLEEIEHIRSAMNMTSGPDEDDEEDPEIRDASLYEYSEPDEAEKQA